MMTIMKSSLYLIRIIHFFPLTFICLALLISCEPKSPEAAAGTGDLSGFEITEIPGSAFQYAVRKDGNGQLVFEGYVSGDKKSGQWLEYNPEGEIILVENYVDGLKEGVALKMTSRGQVDLRSRYHKGILHGPWTQFKFGKVMEERTYNNGKLDGVVKSYDDRTWKLKQEVQYKDGQQHGYYRYYDENGNITLEYEYKNGEKVSGGIVEKK